jgi:hypothetical protein
MAKELDEVNEPTSNATSVAQRLREEISREKVGFNLGDVVRFTSNSASRGIAYNYVAILAGDYRWYLSGGASFFGNGLKTPEFLKVLRGEGVSDVSVAESWVKVL